jgi:hypothetical protein
MEFRARNGRFAGARLNCEFVPCLPANVVGDYLADPRQSPHFLVWNDRAASIDPLTNQLEWCPVQAVRIGPPVYPQLNAEGEVWIGIKQWDGQQRELQIAYSGLPRHGGRTVLIVCFRCAIPRRAVYGSLGRLSRSADWVCRKCAGLTYASEGGAQIFRSQHKISHALSGSRVFPKPQMWWPIVFTSLHRALEFNLIHGSSCELTHC